MLLRNIWLKAVCQILWSKAIEGLECEQEDFVFQPSPKWATSGAPLILESHDPSLLKAVCQIMWSKAIEGLECEQEDFVFQPSPKRATSGAPLILESHDPSLQCR